MEGSPPSHCLSLPAGQLSLPLSGSEPSSALSGSPQLRSSVLRLHLPPPPLASCQLNPLGSARKCRCCLLSRAEKAGEQQGRGMAGVGWGGGLQRLIWCPAPAPNQSPRWPPWNPLAAPPQRLGLTLPQARPASGLLGSLGPPALPSRSRADWPARPAACQSRRFFSGAKGRRGLLQQGAFVQMGQRKERPARPRLPFGQYFFPSGGGAPKGS